ncbi:MAG TPA: hypothetical protein VD834_16530 [Blastococcus sp.]|nr:hypothetical protein [Blastococcus sp.]
MDWKPADLGERGTALWDSVTSAYNLRPDELAILADAAHEADIIERLKAEFASRDLITTGSMGQDVAAPHVSEIRQHRMALAGLLTKLKLPDESGAGGDRSAAGRALVNQRWHPRSAG